MLKDNKISTSAVKKRLQLIEKRMRQEVTKRKNQLDEIHPFQKSSAKNLIHYLTLRDEDIRILQDQLHVLGPSSLASSEGHILRQLQSIQQRMGVKYSTRSFDQCDFDFNLEIMEQKSNMLFGNKSDAAAPFIMVTFDSTFADDYSIIKNLLQSGMNVARINCAHDDEATWSKMIHHIKRAVKLTGLDCKIYMDLAGPKIRTRLINKGKLKGKVKIREGELIWLAEDAQGFQEQDVVISPNETGIIQMLKKSQRVYIDDGIIKGVVESTETGKVSLRIIRISSDKHQIKTDKGINFPDSEISIASLTEFDKKCLPFISEHADLIGYSFIRYPSDLANLQKILSKLSNIPPSIIIKVETPEAVKNLPALLLQGMKQKVYGVMIARGDLAVEIGFERMSEIQEEILWICEAAHVPVVWATQVLESLNKSGMATRSEITDASHSAMAECVMINKGPHTIKVIETLKDILHRSGGHHHKKRFILRPLSIASSFINETIAL